jgi:hypothetical protein
VFISEKRRIKTMKSETIVSKATELVGLLEGLKPLRELTGTNEDAALYRALKGLNSGTRRVIQGPWSPSQLRALCAPEVPKPDLRSDELKALDAEVAQLDIEYKQAVTLWERCTLEKINRHSPLISTASFQIVARTDAKEELELDRKIETTTHLRDQAGDKLQAKRARYYSLLKAEQGERRAAAQREQQVAQLAEKTRAAEARKQSFAKDALEFFGMKV